MVKLHLHRHNAAQKGFGSIRHNINFSELSNVTAMLHEMTNPRMAQASVN